MPGLPVTTREQLRIMPWAGLLCGPVIALFLLLAIPARVALWLAVVLSALGLALGLHVKYRARFAVTQALVAPCVAMALLAVFGAGAAMGACVALGRHGLAAWAGSATALLVALVLLAGLLPRLRAWRRIRAQGHWQAALGRYADLERRVLLRPAQARTPPRLRRAFALSAVAAPGLALLAGWVLEGGRDMLILPVPALLVVTAAYVAWVQVGPSLALYWNLRCWERAHGYTFASDQQAHLAAIRRTFRGSRWYGRPEPQGPVGATAVRRRATGRHR